MSVTIGNEAILMLFYLVLLLKPEFVKNKLFFMIGVAAILLNILFIGIFSIWIDNGWAKVLCGVLSTVFSLITFASAVMACLGCCPMSACKSDPSQNPPSQTGI